MNVLILGAGGREYSIGLALSKDDNVEKIYFAPGNGATDALGENLTISDFSEVSRLCRIQWCRLNHCWT